MSPYVPGVTEPVTQEIQGQQSQNHQSARKCNQPPVNMNCVYLIGTFGDKRSPTGHWRLDAQTKITQKRFIQDDGGHRQSEINNNDAPDVWQNMQTEDARMGGAEHAAGFNKGAASQRQHLSPDDPGHRQP